VFSASSAERAWAELASKQPDRVVLDLGLRDGSGEALCRTIRTLRGGGHALADE
jgi:DNA-binding response OmpR family regulator